MVEKIAVGRYVVVCQARKAGTKTGPRVIVEEASKPGKAVASYSPKTLEQVTGKSPVREVESWLSQNSQAVLAYWYGKTDSVKGAAASPPPPPQPAKKPVTYVGIVRDHSGSMNRLTREAQNDYNKQVRILREATSGQEAYVTVVQFGIRNSGPTIEVDRQRPEHVPEINSYPADGGSTPLFDAVGELITRFESLRDPDASFLIMAVTDGRDNASYSWKTRIGNKIRELQGTDRWTFVFRVPAGYAGQIAELGVPASNIDEWTQTSEGLIRSSEAAQTGVRSFFQARGLGQRATKAFYTSASHVSASDLKENLADITRQVAVHTLPTNEDIDVSAFSQRYLGFPLQKGTIFYQLTKREPKVQDYKIVCIRDKKSGKVYGGGSARSLIGMPHSGTHPIIPADHGQYDIFIQSTSLNRRLPAATKVLYWEGVPAS